jgi:hypothetical protein
MSLQSTTSPELQLKHNSNKEDDVKDMQAGRLRSQAEDAARYIALCSMYLHPRIVESEYYFRLAFAAASERVQRICPNDQSLWDKLIEAKTVIAEWHGTKNRQDC